MYKKATLIVISSFSFLLGWYFLYQSMQIITKLNGNQFSDLSIIYLISLVISGVVCLSIPLLPLRKKKLKKQKLSLMRIVLACFIFSLAIFYLLMTLIFAIFPLIIAIIQMEFFIFLDSLSFIITTTVAFYTSYSLIARAKLE